MTLKKSSNVQEIRGRFENWNNDAGKYKENVIIPLGKPLSSSNAESRNRHFSVFAKGENFAPNNVLSRNNSFHQRNSNRHQNHFSEKQKLVESIVANIKCSNNEKQKRSSYKTVLNSLFDKDLKSIARIQRQNKNNEERQYKENKINSDHRKNSKRIGENITNNKIQYNNYADMQAISDNSVSNTKSVYNDNIADKYMNNLNSDVASGSQKLVDKHQFNSLNILPQPLQRTYEILPEPLRPPRRRVTRKKYVAPQVPAISAYNETPTFRQAYFSNQDQFIASSHHNLSTLENDSTAIDTMNARRNSAGDLYPLDINETPPNYHRDSFSDYMIYAPNPKDMYSLPRHAIPYEEKVSCIKETLLGPPPKKPPRTFAHDIYRQTKYTNLTKSKKDLEALYAKPIKKSKRDAEKASNIDRTVSFVDGSSKNGPFLKPPIAPKPICLNYKRYSVIEPIESLVRNGDEVTTIKRNRSFRFSFRKPNTASPVASKQISRLKDAVMSFHFKRNQDVRSKSEENINSKNIFQPEEDHIYAIPHYGNRNPQEKAQELHYMCSPLFLMANSEKHIDNVDLRTSPQKVKMDWGGLKKEFRQSCRMVQKRLKGTAR